MDSSSLQTHWLSLTVHAHLSLALLLTVLFQSMDSSDWVSLGSTAIPVTTVTHQVAMSIVRSGAMKMFFTYINTNVTMKLSQ